jgi:tetratricopeptide (TPR) repeat protein
MKATFLSSLTILLLVSIASFAQRTSSTSTAPPANPSLGPESGSDIGKYSNWDTLSKQGRSGDYLSGNVTVTGGAFPWDPIPVDVTCDGKIRYSTTADPKGNFVVTSVYNVGSSVGNSDGRSKLTASLIGCKVQAALLGFDSTTLTIGNHNLLDNPNVGTITLKKEEGAESAALSSTTAAAPQEAKKAFEKSRAEWLDRKPEAAQRGLEKAVQVYPQFAEAWYQLGRIQEPANPQEAWTSFSKAAAADPKFILPYEHIAPLAARAGKWQDTADATGRALELNSRGTVELWYYNALANYKLNKKDVAEDSADKALSMDPLHTEPNTEQLLGVILADKHHYAEALQHLRNCLTYLPKGPNLEIVKQQIAQLQQAVPGAQ